MQGKCIWLSIKEKQKRNQLLSKEKIIIKDVTKRFLISCVHSIVSAKVSIDNSFESNEKLRETTIN